jgi:tRNA (guanine-N7-)-methyltransferase
MRTKYKPWARPYIDEHKESTISLEEIALLEYPVYLEIGSGKGQFVCDLANKYNDINFIGVEKNVTCAGFTLKKIVEGEIKNAKLFFGDGLYVLQSLKDKTVKRLFLNFSDPWPKKRHNKRRLTHDTFLKEYLRVLADDGEIVFKTDNLDLFNFSLEKFNEFNFDIISYTYDYQELVEFDTLTEYETNFRNQGIKINRLVARRK